MRTLLEFDSIVFGLYEFDSSGPDREGRKLTRLEIPGDATLLSDGEYTLPLYARATPDFSDYERVEIGPPLEFKLPHPTRGLIGIPSPSLTWIEVPETIITRDGRIFLEESVRNEGYSATMGRMIGQYRMASGEEERKNLGGELLRGRIVLAGEYFQNENVWVHDRLTLERIEREGVPIITEA